MRKAWKGILGLVLAAVLTASAGSMVYAETENSVSETKAAADENASETAAETADNASETAASETTDSKQSESEKNQGDKKQTESGQKKAVDENHEVPEGVTVNGMELGGLTVKAAEDKLQQYIDEVCDKMDYNGSVMYDEFPDKVTLRRISNNIYEMLLNDGVISEEENDVNDDNVDNETEEENNEYEDDDDSDASFYKNMMNLESNQLRPPFGPEPGRPPRPPYPPFGPGPGRPPRPPYPPFGPGPERPPRPQKPPVCNGNNCIADIVDVLLFNEMHRRRCRDNRCF